MPFNASYLQWWAWLLIAVVCFIVRKFVAKDKGEGAPPSLFFPIVIWLAGLAAAVIGIVRFVKWEFL
jgi:hypothetical protein